MNNNVADKSDVRAAFSPNALLNTFANSITSPLLNRMLPVKGIFKPGKGQNYSGMYYDILKDEYSDASITLVVPEAIRWQLKDGQLIEGNTFLGKRNQIAGGRIDLLLNLCELISRQERIIDETEKKALELIQQKAKIGYRDVTGFIKSKLYEQQRINITILIGLTAIIDNDIKHQIKDAATVYNINYIRINLTQVNEIIQALQMHQDCDILVISRGGGENIQIFNKNKISETALKLRTLFITAIGHSSDEPLLQKIADKSFITPTSLGQYLYDIYMDTLDDLNNSKAKMIGDLTKQIELNFQHKITDLNDKLSETARSFNELQSTSNYQTQKLSDQVIKLKSKNSVLFTVVLILSIACAVLFFLRK